jgi:Arc/MetJ family transcription regulator
MRTNIEIDDDLMSQAMKAGPYKTKKDAVEAGLKLLARQASYREILKWRGKLHWEGDESIDWTQAPREPALPMAAEPPPPRYGDRPNLAASPSAGAAGRPAARAAAKPSAPSQAGSKRRAGR